MADSFGDRMKEYEAVSDIHLTKRIPIIIRLGGVVIRRIERQIPVVELIGEEKAA